MNEARRNGIQADALAQALIECGVSGAVLSPGSRNTPIVLAIDARRDSMVVESILDERSAGFFALGLARASGHTVVLCCTSGTAGAHYLPAVIEAAQSNIPLLVLTADRPLELHGTGAPQTVPQTDFFKPHARWSAQVNLPNLDPDGQQISALIRKAVEIAEGKCPGPVHLNIPFAEPLWNPGSSVDAPIPSPEISLRPEGTKLRARDLNTAKAALSNTKQGIILCGHREALPGEQKGHFEALVTDLAQKLQWPIIAEPGSGLRFGPHQRNLVVDHGDLLLRSEDFATRSRPDCVLQLGRSPLTRTTLRWLDQLSWDKKLIAPPPGQYSAHFYRRGRILESGALSLIEALCESIPARESTPWLDTWFKAERVLSKAIATSFDVDRIWEGQLARTLVQNIPPQTRLFVGNSMPGRDLNSYGGGRDSALTVWANRGANGIDGNLATLFGSARFSPTIPHVALVGDLTLLHDIGSVIQMASKAPNVTVIVADNGGGNIFSHLPISDHPEAFERRFLTPPDVDLDSLLKGFSSDYASVDNLTDFSNALDGALPSETFSIVRVKVEREYSLAMHEQTIASAIKAVDGMGVHP